VVHSPREYLTVRYGTMVLGLWLCAVAAQSVPAAAPQVVSQAPGFYRMILGDFEVTALNDGVVAYPTMQVLPKATPQQIRSGLSESGLTDPVGMSYNAFLVNTGSKLILIDTGTGGKLDENPGFHGVGRVMTNLRAAGYQPEQIDEIYITHLGPDHVGGLTLGSERAFPNAMLRAPKAEVDIFLHPDTAPAWTRRWIPFWADLFAPYIKAGKFKSIDADVVLTPGIRALATHGHAPGHTCYVVESKGQTLIVMGDLVLMGALQFADPSLESPFDADPGAAAEQRLRIFKMASADDWWVAGGHLSFPGIGHIRAGQGRYFWIPANYEIPSRARSK
jgi:glyoxylase-like metal-dependent hydrolase (beta-lactamase superfamily II)